MKTTRDALNSVMEPERVIRVDADGSVNYVQDLYAPEIALYGDKEGQVSREAETDMIEYVQSQGWDLLCGWTGQYLAGNSPIMHPSEYIGGALADHILSTPGYYVAVVIDVWPDIPDSDPEMCGWGIAYREKVET